MSEPTLLTVVLNYRTADMTLESVAAALREMEGIDGEITVVDNDSRDGSYEKISAAVAQAGWKRVRVLRSPRNGGYGAGNNFGIHAGLSDGRVPKYVYILNSDAFPRTGAIRTLLDYLETHPDCGFAGSRIVGADEEPHRTAFRFPSILGEFEAAARIGPVTQLLRNSVVAMPIPETTGPVDWLAGASVMIRRRALDAVGFFDEQFFLYFEETDLCRRARRAGWPIVYVPASVVTHIGSVSTGAREWRRTPGYWFESRMYYFTKNHGRVYALMATAASLAGGLIWRLRRLIQRQPNTDPRYFLRDLATHALRGFGGTPRRETASTQGHPASIASAD